MITYKYPQQSEKNWLRFEIKKQGKSCIRSLLNLTQVGKWGNKSAQSKLPYQITVVLEIICASDQRLLSVFLYEAIIWTIGVLAGGLYYRGIWHTWNLKYIYTKIHQCYIVHSSFYIFGMLALILQVLCVAKPHKNNLSNCSSCHNNLVLF